MVHIDNNDTESYYYDDEFGKKSSMYSVNIKDSLSHINQLIDMAEESKKKIVDLSKQLKKFRLRMLGLIAIVYIGMGFFAAYINEQFGSLTNYIPSLYTIVSLIITVCILAISLYVFSKQRSDIRKRIAVERYILKDILSIVFDIRKILDLSDPTGSLWIEFKIVDMRLKRLDFY
ncbi:hypothetical protein [Enterobacter sp. 22325]|uniref:hypothetical protein n=1 Tax=Enterobacter sp. 22325 TaxID=3453911 RepID=UPI003F871482